METVKIWQSSIVLMITVALMSLSKDGNTEQIDWIQPQTTKQIDLLLSQEQPILFFKHSFKCGLSIMMLEDFEKEWDIPSSTCSLVFIDVWKNRNLSDYLSDLTTIRHHSPQVLVLQKGTVIYHQTHSKIRASDIKQRLQID